MGNNSSTGSSNDSASPSSPGASRPQSSTAQRTSSLPVGHHHHQNQFRQRPNAHHQYYSRPGHSDRHHATMAAIASSTPPIPSRRSSSKLRQALPNFMNNVSMAIGQKLPWSNESGKRKFHKSSSSSNYYSASGGKGEKRSRSKTREHCRLFRELVSDWRLSDLHCLVVEFEAALALRELRRRANAARPLAPPLKDDFVRLYTEINSATSQGLRTAHDDSSADAFLLLDGQTFPVHRAFLSKRCPFFRRLFRNANSITLDEHSTSAGMLSSSAYHNGGWRPTVPVTFPPCITPLTATSFGLLLEYLYTGELSTTTQMANEEDFRALSRFNDELRQMSRDITGRCGDDDRKWTTLEEDVAAMLKDTTDLNSGVDALLIFTNSKIAPLVGLNAADSDLHQRPEPMLALEDDPDEKGIPLLVVADKQKSRCCQFKCHSVVLAARSPFFRAIIRKRRLQDEQRQHNDHHNHRRAASSPFSSPWRKSSASSSSPSGLLEIILDESVIPRQYAPVLLHAMYTDEVDLSLVMRDCVANVASSLTEVQAIAAGKCQLSPIDEATEIYQIARFLEFDKLAHGCEDAIVSYITLDNLAAIYAWSTESYGSPYVRRHCVDYLCQEFGRFCASTLLYDTDESLLVEALKSDFVQATELEILNAVIRWGEHQLVRRIEEREPNILVGTTHSISRKGVKRTDLSDEELKEILASLLPLVRVDYVLPANHPVLENAISRGLISVPPVDLLSGSQMPNVLLPPSVVARRQHRKRGGHHRHSPSALVRSCSSSASPNIDELDELAAAVERKSRGHWSQPHRHSAGPRLFLPHLEESRALLEKRVSETPDQLSSLINHHPPVEVVSDRHFMVHRSNSTSASNRYPDTLYMLDDMADLGAYRNSEDLDTSEIAVPPPSTLLELKERVDRILRTSSTVKRALACGCAYHRSGVLKQVRLRSIREFGLLDSTLALLDNYGYVMSNSSIDYERPSYCSSPAGISGVEYCASDLGVLENGAHYTNAPAAKRRFRSQPELSQCDLTGADSMPLSMDWPDLMAMASTCSMEGEYSAADLATSYLSTSSPPIDSKSGTPRSPEWKTTPAISPDLAASSSSGKRYERSQNRDHESKDQLRQQFVDLTQQICDLVVAGDDGPKDHESQRETDARGQRLSSTSSSPLHRHDTTV